MFGKRMAVASAIGVAFFVSLAVNDLAGGDKKTEKKEKKVEKKKEVWTDANDPTLPVDFKFQGEYVGNMVGKDVTQKLGCQVIALGQGRFQAVVLPGGLPGDGWDGKNKSLLDGVFEKNSIPFLLSMGKRKYLAQKPEEFSATSKFPPVGQVGQAGYLDFILTGDSFSGKADGPVEMKKVERKSPTLGMKPPTGATVLFDGTDTKEWNGGRLDKKTGLLNTDGNDITTKRKFNNYTVHVEFMLPYRPDARGQGRGNSGFYQVDQYEVQILDSFGLEGKDNECGGIYTRNAPKVNMCLPPLVWQTYDIEFTNAVREGDKVVKKSRITAKHNGVVIHDNVEIAGVTGGARALSKRPEEAEGTPGVLRLQGHGNPLQFRNIWIVGKQ